MFWKILAVIIALAAVWLFVQWLLEQWWFIPQAPLASYPHTRVNNLKTHLDFINL